MNLTTVRLFLCLYLIVFFCGCQKPENSENLTNPENENNVGVDEIGISGTIFTTNGSHLAGAQVTIEGKTIITNSTGYFEYIGKVKNTDKVVIKVSKQGHLKFSKTLVVEKNAFVEGVNIWLTVDWIAGTFNAATGGTVTNEFTTLKFQPNSFIKENGSNYTGTVTINMYPQPLQSIYRPYPGDARGVTNEKENIVIEGWFGIAAFAHGSQGEELHLSKPLNYALKSTYSYVLSGYKSMALWTYDFKDNIWKQCGTATADNERVFTGTSSDLSYLQLGMPHKPALLKSVVTDYAANKASGFGFAFSTNQVYNYGTKYTTINSNGAALLYVPANIEGRAQIITPCNDALRAYEPKIKPIPTGEKSDQNFLVDLSPFLADVSGKIEDCDYKGITGKAVLELDNKTLTSTLVNGYYNFKLLHCHSFKNVLSVYDESNKLVYQDTTVSINPGNARPPVTLCNKQLSANITIEAEGKTYTFETPRDSISFATVGQTPTNRLTTIVVYNPTNNQGFHLFFPGESIGNFVMDTFKFNTQTKNYSSNYGYEPNYFNVTKYKNGNTLIEGDFKIKTNVRLNGSSAITNFAEIKGSVKITK